jgi:hypothetical protein
MSYYASKELVWEDSCFSSGTYMCRIERNEDQSAKLTITLAGAVDHIIHEEPIVLRLDASGCPEQDIDKWKSRCDNIIDHPKLRSSVSLLSAWFQQ